MVIKLKARKVNFFIKLLSYLFTIEMDSSLVENEGFAQRHNFLELNPLKAGIFEYCKSEINESGKKSHILLCLKTNKYIKLEDEFFKNCFKQTEITETFKYTKEGAT